MKQIVFAAAAGAAMLVAGPVCGQIAVSLQAEPARAVLYEPIQAKVIIRNNTGGVLDFDVSDNSARFFFEIERNKNEPVRQTDRTPLLFGTKMVPFSTQTNLFNLTALYSMRALGVYKVSACLEWHDKLFASVPVEIEIRKGFEIARVIAGVPGEQSALRVYILEYLSKDNGENVYLRIEDDQSKTLYGMFNLGNIVRVRQPEMKVDESGNVHVLFQSLSMVFVHTAFTPYGVQLFSRNYQDQRGAVALMNLPNGQISVSLSQPSGEGATGKNGQPRDVPSTQQQATLPDVRLGRDGLFGPKAEKAE